MFKEVCCRQEHTGGGNGDNVTNLDQGDDEKEGSRKNKKCKKKLLAAKKVRYTKNVLDAFEQSSFFTIIDTM